MLLYLLASYGFNSRIELGYLVSVAEGLKASSGVSGSIKRAIAGLAENNLLVTDTLSMNSPVSTSLAVYRLSNDGRVLCELLGWKPVESEWERLIRLHEGERYPKHTLAVLACSMHARLRGWQTEVVPHVNAKKAAPDLLMNRGDESHYMEVELSNKERPSKWRNLVELQGYVTLCAGSQEQRTQLVRDCKLDRLTGRATDLETLIPMRVPQITEETPFWVEDW